MKKKFIAIIFAIVLSVCALPAASVFADEPATIPEPPATETQEETATRKGYRVSVNGRACIQVTPDTTEIRFEVQTRGKTTGEAQTAAADIIEKAKAAAKTAAPDAQAEFCEECAYSYPVCENGLAAYEYSKSFTLTCKYTENAEALITAVTDAGATRFNGVSHTLKNNADAYKDALAAAKKDAIEKAAALGDGLVLMRLSEGYAYCRCDCTDGKICVEASVRADFVSE